MAKTVSKGERRISPEMTVLDVLNRYRQTEPVFKKYDQQVGACICCESLFEPLKNLEAKHGLIVEELLMDLETVANSS